MIKKLILFLLIFSSILLYSSCNTGFEDKCKGNEHGELKWVVVEDATCTSYGKKEQRCSKCEKVITTATINYKNHEEIVVPEVSSTCTTDGYTEYKKCNVCDTILEEGEILPATGHSYTIDESSSNELVLIYKCSLCNDSYEVENSSGNVCANGHTASSWITTLEATCSSLGSAHKVCTKCNIELEIKSLEKTKHTEVKVPGTPATCGKEGISDGTKCSVCNTVIKPQETLPALEHDYVIVETVSPTPNANGYIKYECSNCKDSYQKELSKDSNYDETLETLIILQDKNIIVSNDNGGVIINNNTVTITLGGEYGIMGMLSEGNIVISASDDDDITINLRGISITSTKEYPIYIESADKVEISAKSDTENYVYDKRAVSTDATGGAIYSCTDLEIKGKGSLVVNSECNNGIATTKDLEIKNLSLNVTAVNNAIKGNDSLTIESGTITAISTKGDALKTENSDISSKGNQKGTITIIDGTINLYAACDGIDAAYDCIIDGGIINIYTESYSKYSGEVTQTSTSTIYLRISSKASGLGSISKYSALFISDSNTQTWANGTYLSSSGKKYYKFDLPSNTKYIKFYAYSSSQTQGQSTSYSYATDQLSMPLSQDTYYVTSTSSSRMSGSWENFNSPTGPGGGMGGPGGGMQEGNPDKSDYSCKGIKADNSISINGGSINIESHDDAIHTNSDVLLENGNYGLANLNINGGDITITSDDDGIHADSTLTVNGGNIIINKSYEGLEGNYIYFNGGSIQIKSSDDGINAKTTLYFKGSFVYLDAGGDGIDSNGNVYMTDGIVLALGPTNGGNGVIDYGDRNCTFSFTGGLLLAIGCSGMNAKPTAGTGNTVSATTPGAPSTNSYLVVTSNNKTVAIIKVVKSNQNYRVLAYNNATYPNTTVSVVTSVSYTLTNGLYYVDK